MYTTIGIIVFFLMAPEALKIRLVCNSSVVIIQVSGAGEQ